MARWERSIEIEATPARVWTVMGAIEQWPRWTASIRSVEDISPEMGVGGSATVSAQGTPKSKWTVSRWQPGQGFDWTTSVRGVRTVGGHWIEGAGEGRSRVTLSIEVAGLAGALGKPFIGKGIRRNLDMEAEGLKRESEKQERGGSA